LTKAKADELLNRKKGTKDQRETTLLQDETVLLEEQVEEVRNRVHSDETMVRSSIIQIMGWVGLRDENLSFRKRNGEITGSTDPSGDCLIIDASGPFEQIKGFLNMMPELKGIPHAWKVTEPEKGKYLNLWMEIEP
ncbi:MAG: hypothetical protein ACYTG7_24530, partial [Planctomycetota bacterium]|jgi:hypothetical protein